MFSPLNYQLSRVRRNNLNHATPILVEQMLNAENRMERSTVSAHQIISVILTALVDLNVSSIRIAHGIRAVLEANVSILVLVLVVQTQTVVLLTTSLFAPAKNHIPAILTDLVDLFP